MSTPVTSNYYDSTLYNADLRPIPRKARTWNSWAYMALWIGMCINAATWTLAAALIAMGMDWIQAVMTIVVANMIILIPMVCNSHAGAKHGICFPVFSRAAFGTRGANLPALIRATVGCGWAGIQTWFTALALDLAIGAVVGSAWTEAPTLSLGFIGEMRITLWACFLVTAVLQVIVIAKGFEAVKQIQQISGPIITVAIVVLLVYLLIRSGGNLGPVVSQPSQVGWGKEFWLGAFPPGLMANIAFWAALSLNMPDFTRFAQDQKSQIRGQIFGLPTSMLAFSLLAVLTTSIAAYVFDVLPDTLWSPDALVAVLGNPAVVVIGALIITLANFSTNVAANMVGPALDFTNIFPRYISRSTGVILVMVIGTCMLPWKLLASPESYIFVWLGFYGGVTGAIGGILIADYWLMRRTKLNVPALFLREGEYTYNKGWNMKAVIAFIAGAIAAVGGAYSDIVDGVATGPFPEHGFIPILQPLYDYNWVVSFVVGMAVYLLLNVPNMGYFKTVKDIPFPEVHDVAGPATSEPVVGAAPVVAKV